jgi:hypothetical protein
MTDTDPPRTAAANAARTRRKLERLAETLRLAGWTVHEPAEDEPPAAGGAPRAPITLRVPSTY